jgi:hypothetical protein
MEGLKKHLQGKKFFDNTKYATERSRNKEYDHTASAILNLRVLIYNQHKAKATFAQPPAVIASRQHNLAISCRFAAKQSHALNDERDSFTRRNIRLIPCNLRAGSQ